MLGLSPHVALHHLVVKSSFSLVKQAKRKFSLIVETLISAEIMKLKVAKFIREVYPDCIANIVLIKKKNDQLRICVDFRDLNEA